MKSKQQESPSCKDCIFAGYGQPIEMQLCGEFDAIKLDVQTSCAADRLDPFVDRHEAFQTVAQPYFSLTRLCNMKRDDAWRKEVQEKYAEEYENHTFIEDLVDIASDEVMPLFGIAIQDHPDTTNEGLENTVNSVIHANYPTRKMKTVISTFAARGINNVMHQVNFMQEKNHNAEAIFHVVFEPKIKDTEVFKKLTQAHYFVNIFAGATLDKDFFTKVNQSLNEDMEKVVMFECDRGYTAIRKEVVTGLYLRFNNYEDTVDEVRRLAKEKDVYRKV